MEHYPFFQNLDLLRTLRTLHSRCLKLLVLKAVDVVFLILLRWSIQVALLKPGSSFLWH